MEIRGFSLKFEEPMILQYHFILLFLYSYLPVVSLTVCVASTSCNDVRPKVTDTSHFRITTYSDYMTNFNQMKNEIKRELRILFASYFNKFGLKRDETHEEEAISLISALLLYRIFSSLSSCGF